MPLDPDLEKMFVAMRAAAVPDEPPTPAQARETLVTATRFLAPASRQPQVGEVGDVDAGGVPARVVRPATPGPHPVVVHLHGGGFVVGTLESYDHTIRRLARDADAVVVSVDYRLAPEAPYPSAVEDALAAARWVVDHAADLGGDGTVSVAGDSAGGNLAAVVAQELREEIHAQLLVYPLVDHGRRRYASRKENGSGYGLEISQMSWYRDHYLGPGDHDLDHPWLSPVCGDLAGLPRALVVTAEFDPLRDEGEAYGRALAEAGTAAEVVRYDGLVHGFTEMGILSPAVEAAIDDLHARFGALLRAGRPAAG